MSDATGGDGPLIPPPRASLEDGGRPLPDLASDGAGALPHAVLRSLLGAWALAACPAPEAAAVEEHLGVCGTCAEEALRLRDAVGLLHPQEPLDLDPELRGLVLDGCLDRRPPRVPVPPWAAPFEAETARLDALLQDFGEPEWDAPVRLRWYEADEPASRRTTVAGVIAHLLAVDGLVALALDLADPLAGALETELPGSARTGPADRTEAYWRSPGAPATRAVREPWREQGRRLVREAAGGGDALGRRVDYGGFALPLEDSLLERAFECWIHAEDIAEAVHYPYEPPAPRHLHRMIDLAARLLPVALAGRRAAGAEGPQDTGKGRVLRLEVDGAGGGEWLIALDSPAAQGPPGPGAHPVLLAADPGRHEVAHVALDGVEFCRLAAGHVAPAEAAAGQSGDRAAIDEVLLAAASLSRL